MKYTFLSILLVLSLSILGQKRWMAKDVVKLEDADIYLEITDYQSALDIYLRLYKIYGASENMEYKIGQCYFNLNLKEEAREYFERSKESGNPNSCFYLGRYYHELENFDEAIHQFQVFKNMEGKKEFELPEADRLIEVSERAKFMVANPVHAKVYNAGEYINSIYDDYSPLITADESMMVFTSRREGTTGDKKDPYGEYLEDIYVAFRENDEWVKVENAGPPLNTKTHDASVGLSPDGNSMVIYRTNKELSAGDLYITHAANGGWSEPLMLDEAINTEYQEASASIINDDRVIYFSSNRPGGFGGKDIYRVVKLSDNLWSLPMNLGPTINTAYDEDAPFIHSDGVTLYFSSKGHKTMGGYDIFKTTMNEDYWSTPQNIGYPANTVKDDIFFVLTADGKRGYYSTQLSDGFGGYDIYAVSFEDVVESLRIIKGHITNENGQSLDADIDLLSESGESYGIYKTNPKTGNYIIILPPDENFVLVVRSEGNQEEEMEVFYQGGTNVKEKVIDFTLTKELGQ